MTYIGTAMLIDGEVKVVKASTKMTALAAAVIFSSYFYTVI